MCLIDCKGCLGGGTILRDGDEGEEICPNCLGHGKEINIGDNEDSLQVAYLALKFIIDDCELYSALPKVRAAAESLDELMVNNALAAYEQRMEQ